MKYIVRTYNDWTKPYSYSAKDSPLIREKESIEQETSSRELVTKMVKDWLDAPDREFAEADVRREFDSEKRRLADEYVAKIVAYYNGRREIYLKFMDDFEAAGGGKAVLRYDIPYELNHFETEPFEVDSRETQNDSYFEVEAVEDDR